MIDSIVMFLFMGGVLWFNWHYRKSIDAFMLRHEKKIWPFAIIALVTTPFIILWLSKEWL